MNYLLFYSKYKKKYKYNYILAYNYDIMYVMYITVHSETKYNYNIQFISKNFNLNKYVRKFGKIVHRTGTI